MAASRTLKTLIGIVVGVVVVVLIALAALPALVNVNQYHDRIQSELQKALGRPVTLGQMELKTFPVRIRVNDVKIGEDPRFGAGPFATANQLDVSVKLLPLLSKNIEVNSLELVNPKVELVRDAQGVWNYSTLGGSQSNQPKSSSSGQQLSVGKLKLTDGSVTVIDRFHPPGERIAQTPKQSTYDHIDLEVDDFAPNQRFGVNLTAHLPGQGNQSIALKGDLGPLNQTNSAATPVDAKLTLNSVQIASLQQFLNSDALKDTAGVASGDMSLKNNNGNFAANGDLKLTDGTLHGVQLGYPLSANFDVKGDLNSELYNISRMDVKLGPTPISVTGQVNEKANPAIADMRIKASDASLAEIARLAAAFGVAVSEDAKVAGKLNADISAKGPLDAPAMNGTLQLSGVQLSGAQIKQPVGILNLHIALSPTQLRADPFTVNSGDMHINCSLTATDYAAKGSAPATPKLQFSLSADKINVEELQSMFSAAPKKGTAQHAQAQRVAAHPAQASQSSALENVTGNGQITVGQLSYQDVVLNNVKAEVQLDHGIVRLAPLTSEIFGGSENGTITVDTRPAQPVITSNLQVQKVDANKLLSATTSVKQKLYGLLNAGGNLAFTNTPNNNIASTLNGTLNLNLQNGKLAGIDLLRELGSIAKFGAGGNGVTNLAQLSGNFNIRNGLAHTDNLKAAIDGGTLAGIGDINLATQQLNMKVTAVLSSAMSKQVGGTGVGGYLNTALANNKGELVIPVLVSGTFQSPSFQPDVNQLAQMKLKNLLPTTSNPAGALAGFLGGGTGNGKGGALSGVLGARQGQQGNTQQQPAQQDQPANPLGGLLNQLGKRKPK